MNEKEMKEKTFNLLDVREENEFVEGKLPFTHHIPLANLEDEYTKISQETPLVVYCRSGARSLKACQFLQTKGYHVFNLAGGINSFKS